MPKRTDISKILIIGSGPIVIGQSAEFDYSGTQACKALKSEGYEVVLVNSNPATIMTDPEMADRTYIEPITREYLTEIIRIEREMSGSKGFAILPTVGGQTALNMAMELSDGGILDKFDVQFQTGCGGFNERLGIPRVSALGDHLIVKRRGTLPREFDSVHGSIL